MTKLLKFVGWVMVASRYVMLVPILVMLACALFLIVFQSISVLRSVYLAIGAAESGFQESKLTAIRIIETVDVFLIAIAVHIIGIGLFRLFVDENAAMPGWLVIDDLDDLKDHLVSVVIAVLSILFLKEAVAWNGSDEILHLGAAIGIVLAPLVFYLSINRKKG